MATKIKTMDEIRGELIIARKLNERIAKLQAQRDAIVDPLVKQYGNETITRFYNSVIL